ncbi:MAG: response regulator, partial [Phycisphaerae bacterium]|nr:response regulator [Phycisphaerae bacterium]
MVESASQSTPVRVLLVEDDEDDYILTRGLLTAIFKDQCDLQWVQNFDVGLSRLLSEAWDIALVDYRLGAPDGTQLIRDARAKGCHIPIILLTGQNDREIDLAAMEAGASDFLSKTEVNSAMLERAIRYSMQNAKLEEHRVRLMAERAARAEAEAGNR